MATSTRPESNGAPGTALTPRALILNTVERYGDEIAKLAPRGMQSDFYVTSLRLYMAQNPKLQECDPVSVAQGILRVAQSGLDLGVSCDLLPFKTTCQFNARYNGLVELALGAGVRSITADVVRDDDVRWEFQKGTENYLRHRRGPGKGKITHAYALAELKPGSYVFEVLTRDEIDAVRKQFSKSWWKESEKKGGRLIPLEEIPWYPKKRAIRFLSPLLPKNARFAAALRFDSETEEIPEGEFEVVPDARIAAAPESAAESNGATEAQTERLLDLIEHPAIGVAAKARVAARIKTGLTYEVAATWIGELERVIAAVPAPPDAAIADSLFHDGRAENEKRAAEVGL